MRIPKNFIQDLKLERGSGIEISRHNQSLIIKPKKLKKQKEYTLKELLKGITPENRHQIIFNGPDVGKEKTIW